MAENENTVSDVLDDKSYKYGFTTKVEAETFAKGLNEDVIRAISKKKNEPEFLRPMCNELLSEKARVHARFPAQGV